MPKARITAIINQKGGVAKTTTAHALSTGLTLRGYKVLTIDTDPQGNLSGTMDADITLPGIYNAFCGDEEHDLVQHTAHGDMIASNQALIGADRVFNDIGREYLLREALQHYSDLYDHIIIDCPPTISIITINALTAATDLIVPVGADIYSLQGMGQLFDNINKVQKFSNPNLKIAGLLICRKNGRAVLTKQFSDYIGDLAAKQNVSLYRQSIREAIAVKESQAQHTSLFISHPKASVTADYNAFIDEYLQQEKGE